MKKQLFQIITCGTLPSKKLSVSQPAPHRLGRYIALTLSTIGFLSLVPLGLTPIITAMTLAPAEAAAQGWRSYYDKGLQEKEARNYGAAATDFIHALQEVDKLTNRTEHDVAADEVVSELSTCRYRFQSEKNWKWVEYICQWELSEAKRKDPNSWLVGNIMKELSKALVMQGRTAEATRYDQAGTEIQQRPQREMAKAQASLQESIKKMQAAAKEQQLKDSQRSTQPQSQSSDNTPAQQQQ